MTITGPYNLLIHNFRKNTPGFSRFSCEPVYDLHTGNDYAGLRFFVEGNSVIPELTRVEFRFIIEDLERSGLRRVRIYGGDPAAQPNLVRLCDFLVSIGYEVDVETSGLHLDVLSRLLHTGASIHLNVSADRDFPFEPVLFSLVNTVTYYLEDLPSVYGHPPPVSTYVPSDAMALRGGNGVYVSPVVACLFPPGNPVNGWEPSQVDQTLTRRNFTYSRQYALKHKLGLILPNHLWTSPPND